MGSVAWVAWVALIAPAGGRASKKHQYHAHRRRAFFVEAKVAVGKNKASKATPASDNCKGRVQRKVLVDQVHVSGALSGARTGKWIIGVSSIYPGKKGLTPITPPIPNGQVVCRS